MLLRCGSVLFILICLSETVYLQKCATCKPKVFPDKSKVCETQNNVTASECVCPEKEFCNVSEKKCKPCDDCFKVWDNKVEERRGEVEGILEALAKRYAIDVDELEKLIQTLLTNLNQQESDVKRINYLNNKVNNEISKVQSVINKRIKEIEEIEKGLKSLGFPISREYIINYLKKILDEVRTLVNTLKDLKFDTDDTTFLEITAKIKNIENHILEMNRNFPHLQENSLGLASAVESDINEYKSLINKSAEGRKDIEDIPKIKNTRWIEDDIVAIFEILNNYLNVSINGEELLKNATRISMAAEETRSKLNNLLQKHEDFEKQLKRITSELQFFQEVHNLNIKLHRIIDEREKLEALLKLWRIKKQLAKEIEKLKMEIDKFKIRENLIKNRYKERLDKLLNKVNELLEQQFLLNIELKSFDEYEKEIGSLLKKIQKIQKEIKSHCSVGFAARHAKI